ncbi:MAG: OmpA family protein [Myxococcales bacterium]|nr:OmpA family protein [Myxococcales bacterium]
MRRAIAIAGLTTLLGLALGCVAARSGPPSTALAPARSLAPAADAHPDTNASATEDARDEVGPPRFQARPGDWDGDGLADDDDACPDLPEDFDDFEDDDGCPDRDNDGDGIPDAHEWLGDRWSNCDQQTIDGVTHDCRNIPEDFDGVADHDGCHDESICYPPRLDTAPTYDEATLRFAEAEVEAALAEAKEALAERPGATLTLTGLSGSMRSAAEEYERSLKAAEALRRALVRRGLPRERLEVRGVGDISPYASNRSAEERRANFRVELVGSWGCEPPPTGSLECI